MVDKDSGPDREGTPASPDLYHVYLDLVTGTWGDRKDLAILTLTSDQMETFAEMSDQGRRDYWKGSVPYFGNVADASGRTLRRHLGNVGGKDLPK